MEYYKNTQADEIIKEYGGFSSSCNICDYYNHSNNSCLLHNVYVESYCYCDYFCDCEDDED